MSPRGYQPFSRDPHLRNLKHYHGVQIVDATAFIEEVAKTSLKNR